MPDEAEPEGGDLRIADGDQDSNIELLGKRSSQPLQNLESSPLSYCIFDFLL
jgi:hypothetical protein